MQVRTLSCVIFCALLVDKIQTKSLATAKSQDNESNESEIIETDAELTAGLFEGDMNITLTRNGLISTTKRWPNGVVYYKISNVFDYAHSTLISIAMQTIERSSCIHFVPTIPNKTDFVEIVSSLKGCTSEVGYMGRPQYIALEIAPLGSKCFKFGSVVHELLHTLGFHHQHSAPERDEYIKVVKKNIIEGKKYNFRKFSNKTVTNFGFPYDYGSIMHYSSWAFSKNRRRTIIPLKPHVSIGQRNFLSRGDIDKLRRMYNC